MSTELHYRLARLIVLGIFSYMQSPLMEYQYSNGIPGQKAYFRFHNSNYSSSDACWNLDAAFCEFLSEKATSCTPSKTLPAMDVVLILRLDFPKNQLNCKIFGIFFASLTMPHCAEGQHARVYPGPGKLLTFPDL